MRSIIPIFRSARVAAFAILMLSAWLTGCAVNPATGDQSFVGFLPPEDEAEFGAENHPNILRQFGGAYDDPKLNAYVSQVGQSLAGVAERPDLTFKFTILDSETVNAFAIPGGYVYVTRGLLALADNEAELASVLGHEIGHITALHGAQRVSRGALAGLGAAILGAAIGQDAVTELLEVGASALLQGYSREQELEADTLGIRYLTRVGYDPRSSAVFLAKLREASQIQARLAGGGDPDGFDLFASHPRPIERVRRAAGLAANGNGETRRDRFLDQIDGLIFGGSPRHGFIRGRAFLHPDLRIGFTVPMGFRLQNNPNDVRATNADRSAGLMFDSVRVQPDLTAARYLRQVWAPTARFLSLDRLRIGGREAATGLLEQPTPNGTADLRLLAIRDGANRIYRFVFINKSRDRGQYSNAFRDTAFSFRTLTEQDLSDLRPERIEIVRAKPGDTVTKLANEIPDGPLRVERFMVLNGLAGQSEVTPGMRLKVIR
jgi:predicted Zn-dependent protease